MKIQRKAKWLAAAALSLVFSGPSPALAAEMHEVSCELKEDDLAPDYKGAGQTHCSAANSDEKPCHGVLHRIDLYSTKLRAHKKESCDQVSDAAKGLSALHGVDTYLDATINLYEGVQRKYDVLGAELSKAYDEMQKGMGPVLTEPPAGKTEVADAKDQREQVAKVISKPAQLAQLRVPKTEKPSDITDDIHKRRFAMNNGVNFMKDLIRESVETSAAKAKLGQKIASLKEAREKRKSAPSAPPPTTPAAATAPGSGFNPTALMGLATAAAGLAGMMNKQAADSGMPAATSPTPDSLNPVAEKPAIAVSKLDNGKSTAPGKIEVQPKGTDTNTAAPAPGVPSGSAMNDDSDISNSTPPPTAQAAPASSKAPGGSSSGSTGGDSGPLVAARDPSAVPSEQKEEEAMQGIGGGGLSGAPGGSSSPGAPMDPGVAAAEESMKELLTEMKETADGGTDGSPGEIQADGSIMEMDAEDLFPRVRAAHVRSLKQGRVLNGLGEKITPDPE